MEITRELVLEVTRCSLEDFNNALKGYFKTKQKKPSDFKGTEFDGIDEFIKDFKKEGYCKKEPPQTEKEWVEHIESYAEYWF